MKMLKLFFFFTLIITYGTCYSQDVTMNKQVKEIIALGKDSIVQLALNKIDKKINKENFTEVKILTNGEEVSVYFATPIEYLPKSEKFYFGARVNLLSKRVHYNSLVYYYAPGDYNREAVLHYNRTQTKVVKEKVLFVLKALKDSRYSGSINIVEFDDEMTIREYENYYGVGIFLGEIQAGYKIDKASGEVYDEYHDTILPDPTADPSSFEDINQFKEIDWSQN